MYIVEVRNKVNDEWMEILVFDFEELLLLLKYIKDSDKMELVKVEEKWMAVGLDDFKEIVEEKRED